MPYIRKTKQTRVRKKRTKSGGWGVPWRKTVTAPTKPALLVKQNKPSKSDGWSVPWRKTVTATNTATKPASIVKRNKLSKSEIDPIIRARDLFYVAVSSITYLSPQAFNYLFALITKVYKQFEAALRNAKTKSEIDKILLTLVQQLDENSKVSVFTRWRKDNHTEIVFNPVKRMFFSLSNNDRNRVVFNPRTFMQNVIDTVGFGTEKKKVFEPIEVPVSPWNPTVVFFHDPKVDGNGYLVVEDSDLAFTKEKSRRIKITISFRGSSSATNWIENSKSLVKRLEAVHSDKEKWKAFTSFPLGFLNSLNPLMLPIMKVITAILSDTTNNVPVELAITGHSLGGAMASIMFLVLMTSKNEEIQSIRNRISITNIHLYAISPPSVLSAKLLKAFVNEKSNDDPAVAEKLAIDLKKDTTLVWTVGDPVIHMPFGNDLLPGFYDTSPGFMGRPIKSHTTLCMDDTSKHCITSFYDNAFIAKATELASEKDTSSDYIKKCLGAHVVTVTQKAVPFTYGTKPGAATPEEDIPAQEHTMMTKFVDRFFESDRKSIEKSATEISKNLNQTAVFPLFSKLNAIAFYRFITGACQTSDRENGCPLDIDSINRCLVPDVVATQRRLIAAGGGTGRTKKRTRHRRSRRSRRS